MRKFKFKAWDKKRKQMSGNTIDLTKKKSDFWFPVKEDKFEIAGQKLEIQDMELLPFIGLNDINDKEIYEGDIVRVKACYNWGGWKEGTEKIGYIKWCHKCLSYELGHKSGSDSIDFDSIDIEVLGNIYENKELLETQ